MPTPAPLVYGPPATVILYTPGNGFGYRIVYGHDFVCLPDFGKAATMSPHPAEWTYVAEKLDLVERDAKAVFEALNPSEELRSRM